MTIASPLTVFYRGFGEYYKNEREKAAHDFNKAYELEPALLQAQVGEALREGIENRQPKGVAILQEAEKRVEDLDVRDPEATYKIAQAYSALDEKRSALRVLERSVDKGFFPYPHLAFDPLLDNLCKEPAFASIVQKARQRHEGFKRSFFGVCFLGCNCNEYLIWVGRGLNHARWQHRPGSGLARSRTRETLLLERSNWIVAITALSALASIHRSKWKPATRSIAVPTVRISLQ